MDSTKNMNKKVVFDIHYLLRMIYQNLIMIVCMAVIVGCISYIGLDQFMSGTYQVSSLIVVKPKGNTELKLRDYYNEEAVDRGLSLLNSDVLIQRTAEKYGKEATQGSLTATEVGDTNVIKVTVSAENAAQAYLMMECINKTYPALHDYFENGFTMNTINTLSTKDISYSRHSAVEYALVSGFAVIACALGVLYFFCLLTDRVHNEEQAKAILDGGIIGNLPYVDKNKNKAILLTYEDVSGVYIEDLEKTTSAILSYLKRHHRKSLMITSLCENEGKSTVAVNLAINMARRGHKVVLLDLDMRRPAVNKIMDFDPNDITSLSSVLSGKLSVQQALVDDTAHWNIHFLYQERPVKNPDILLENGRLKEIIEELKKEFDYIVIDTPPIGAVRDAEIISGMVDAFSIVVRQDFTRAVFVNDSIDKLEEAGARFCGTVLNYMKNDTGHLRHHSQYGYGKYGYDKYGYGKYGYGRYGQSNKKDK